MNILVLDTTTKTLVAKLEEAHETEAPVFTSHYYDSLTDNVGEQSHDGVFNGASYVTLVTSPDSGKQRVIKEVTLYNADSIEHTFTIAIDVNSTIRIIYKLVLASGAAIFLSKITDVINMTGLGSLLEDIHETEINVGSATEIPVLTFDRKGRMISATTVTIRSGLEWISVYTDTLLLINQGALVHNDLGSDGESIAITLPANPAIGDIVGIADVEGTANEMNIIIDGNGSMVQGVAELEVDINDAAFTLIYTAEGWKIETYLSQGFDENDLYGEVDDTYVPVKQSGIFVNSTMRIVDGQLIIDGLDAEDYTSVLVINAQGEIAKRALSEFSGNYLDALDADVSDTGTMPSVTNTDNVVEVTATMVDSTAYTVKLGSMAAFKAWHGDEGDLPGTRNADTLYFVNEEEL
jgi:hypothetical protein